jgi:hypothetical protein
MNVNVNINYIYDSINYGYFANKNNRRYTCIYDSRNYEYMNFDGTLSTTVEIVYI